LFPKNGANYGISKENLKFQSEVEKKNKLNFLGRYFRSYHAIREYPTHDYCNHKSAIGRNSNMLTSSI